MAAASSGCNVQVLDAGAGLPHRAAMCLGVNPQGRAWIGFEHGGLFAGNTKRFDRLTGDGAEDLQNLVSSIAVAPDSTVWVGTPGAGPRR